MDLDFRFRFIFNLFIGWKDSVNTSVLENLSDINAIKRQGGITVDLARPMDKDHVVKALMVI